MTNKSSKFSQGKQISTPTGTIEVLKNLGKPNGTHTRLIVRFIDTGYVTECQASNLASGKVKDHKVPSVYGVGYLDGIKIQPRGTEQRRIYDLWANMLKRTYGGYDASYEDVTVHPLWHSLRNFMNTFTNIPNYQDFLDGKDVHLDKDLRVPENRMYSLKTCQFISAKENTDAARAKRWGKA